MKILILLLVICSLSAESVNMTPTYKPKKWNHSIGNTNNFMLYGVDVSKNMLFTVNLQTGYITNIGKLGIDIATIGIDIDNKGIIHGFASVGKRKTSKKFCYMTIDPHTGKATVKKSFTSNEDRKVGMEILNGVMYWSNSNSLFRYNISNGGSFVKVLDFKKAKTSKGNVSNGSWCLIKGTGNNLYGISIKTRQLMEIDVKTKKVTYISSMEKRSSPIPAFANTPGGRSYTCDIKGNVYCIPDYKSYSIPVYMGTLSKVCYAFAICNKQKTK